MISIVSGDKPLDRRFLDAAGGFAWWYVDLVDEQGNGMVVIWSFGLPFLPGYARSARQGRPPRAGERPSVNVAIYQNGELDCYLLQEYPREQVSWTRGDEETWRFGRNRFVSRLEDGRRVLQARLDCPVPGSAQPLAGTFSVEGVVPGPVGGPVGLPADGEHVSADHHWAPLAMPADGRADLRHGDVRYEINGRAYHDCNGGSAPLHELGIDRWIWGRLPMEDREIIFYALWPQKTGRGDGEPTCFSLSIDREDGAAALKDSLAFRGGTSRRNLGGLQWFEDFELGSGSDVLQVQQNHVVDSGPFYMRFITEGRDADGRRATGVSELIRPDRIDLDRHRPLVRMRVHDLQAPKKNQQRHHSRSEGTASGNSMWLPLFTGPRRGRIKRLFRYVVKGAFRGAVKAAVEGTAR